MVPRGTHSFPKDRRLLTSRDFQLRPSRRITTEKFSFIVRHSERGKLGISLSKKVLRHSIARNRVKRLVREAFRQNIENINDFDVHVIGRSGLTNNWKLLGLTDIAIEFRRLSENIYALR